MLSLHGMTEPPNFSSTHPLPTPVVCHLREQSISSLREHPIPCPSQSSPIGAPSFTPSLAIPWRETSIPSHPIVTKNPATTSKPPLVDTTKGIMTQSGKVLSSGSQVTRSSTLSLPPIAPRFRYDAVKDMDMSLYL